MKDYFVYCVACQRRVQDPSKVCVVCNSGKDMVDWVEPDKDTEEWQKWNTARFINN